MQIQVFIGNAGDSKTSKLQEIQDRLEWMNADEFAVMAQLLADHPSTRNDRPIRTFSLEGVTQ
ncbi:hypothetical protein PFUM301597_57000 [Pseudomonas fluorescens]